MRRLCDIADKYAATDVIKIASADATGPLISKYAPELLALALIYRVPTVASLALKAFDSPYICQQEHCDCMQDMDPSDRTPVFSLDETFFKLVLRIPAAVLVLLHRQPDQLRRHLVGRRLVVAACAVDARGQPVLPQEPPSTVAVLKLTRWTALNAGRLVREARRQAGRGRCRESQAAQAVSTNATNTTNTDGGREQTTA